MLTYPARIVPDGDRFAVSFPDIPEALTDGGSREEAVANARDALETAMEFYFEDRRPVPSPSPLKRGQVGIELPASLAAKVLLLNAMLEEKVTPAELARRLTTTRQEVNRIVTLGHTTKIDTIADALGALGRTLVIGSKRTSDTPKAVAGLKIKTHSPKAVYGMKLGRSSEGSAAKAKSPRRRTAA